MTKEPKRKTKRLHAPEQAEKSIEQRIIEAEQSALAAQANAEAKDFDGPIKWRDRIREIDSTVESLEEERESLIQRLEEEGFKLLRVDGKVMPEQPELDMRDWRNWLPGDFVDVIAGAGGYFIFEAGGIHRISQIDYEDEKCPVEIEELWFSQSELYQLKWHSRPSK